MGVSGSDRQATVHLPLNRADGRKLPLVVAIHGHGDSPRGFSTKTELSKHADATGYAVIYPASVGDEWDMGAGSDVDFIAALINWATASGCIDRTRVYVTGFSVGGGMTNIVGCRLADHVAAIAPVSGIYGATWGDPCDPARPVPVIAFAGTADPVVPYNGGDINDFPEWAGRPVDPVKEWAADWASRNRCTGKPRDGTRIDDVQPLLWTGCDAAVTLYSVEGGGHTWPGGANDPGDGRASAVSANDLIWEFFSENTTSP